MMDPLRSETLLSRLAAETRPSQGAKARLKNRIIGRIADGGILREARGSVAIPAGLRERVWTRVGARIADAGEAAGALRELRDFLRPSHVAAERVRRRWLSKLTPAAQVAMRPFVIKWAAAFAVFGLTVRLSPLLFLAPPTTAESLTVLLPTRGEVALSIGGAAWQQVREEQELRTGMMIRTEDGGEASIVLHDEAVVRLDGGTTVELQDLSDRKESAPDHTPTLVLYTGRVWVQGLIPAHIRGVTIATSYGLVTVKEGSVSVAEDEIVDVEVYDRRATVVKDGSEIILVSGERMQLWEGNIPMVKRIADARFEEEWPRQNLSRDAVHREDIADLQNQRLIRSAGILPTSPLYPVKRIAETMDVMLTIGGEARAEKRLQNAETRLNEAAALLASGQDMRESLEEYRGTMLALAGAEDDGSFIQFLVRQSVHERSAAMAAALPGDESYPLKKAVLEASATLPETVASEEDAQGELLVDALIALTKTVEAGDVKTARAIWVDLQPSLAAFHNEEFALRPEVQKEAQSLLTFFAVAISEVGTEVSEIDPELMSDITAYLPPALEPEVPVLSEEEVARIVQGIYDNIFVYHLQRPRLNQFRVEMTALAGHPEQGRILRRLAKLLPEGPEQFPERVQKEIVQLRWKNVAEEGVL